MNRSREGGFRMLARILPLWLIAGLLCTLAPLQEKPSAVNVEISVRVFNGSAFVAWLTAENFKVLKNGIAQVVLA